MSTWHTEWFKNLEEVEYVFGVTLYGEQEMMILEYLKYGIVPDNQGCWTCNAGAMRKLIAQIRDYEYDLKNGDAIWPWTSIQEPSSELTPVPLQALLNTSFEIKVPNLPEPSNSKTRTR